MIISIYVPKVIIFQTTIFTRIAIREISTIVIGMENFVHLGLALALGLLIGVERGWQERDAAEGSRIAGIRTFGLIGLLGGLWALLSNQLGELLLGIAYASFAAVLITHHIYSQRLQHDVGITTTVAALITFALGAMAILGYREIATAGAVITALLLSLKPTLHRALQHLQPNELHGALKLLLISVVLLPILPDEGYGPWQAINPYETWWMVVLIAALSFIGYFAVKLAGTQRGLLLTAFTGGLVSSTAITLNYARLGKHSPQLNWLLASGIVVASATLFPRMLIFAAIINSQLFKLLAMPLLIMCLCTYLAAYWMYQRQARDIKMEETPLKNPFELLPAIQFGLLLVVVLLLVEGARQWQGDTGVYVATVVSSLADVDAINLSLARLSSNGLGINTAATAIVLASIVNTITKGILVLLIAGPTLALRVLPAFILIALLGGSTLLI